MHGEPAPPSHPGRGKYPVVMDMDATGLVFHAPGAVKSCVTCRQNKKKCAFEGGNTRCKRCISLDLGCTFDLQFDRRRKPAATVMPILGTFAEMFVDRFFNAQAFKSEVVPKADFKASLAYYSAETAAPPPAGWWTAPPVTVANPPRAFLLLLNAVLSIGAALCGRGVEAKGYYSAAEGGLKAVDITVTPASPPLVSGVLLLGYLAQGLSQDRSRSSFLYSMAADMAAKCPHLTASVRIATLLASDQLNSGLPSASSSSGVSALAAPASSPGQGVAGIPAAEFDELTRGMALGNAVLFGGAQVPNPTSESVAIRFQALATKHGVLVWLPIALVNTILRFVTAAKTRVCSADKG